MYDNQQRIALKINQLKITSDKTNILTYYYNFDNIHDTLLYFLQRTNVSQTFSSKFLRSKQISSLKFKQDGIFQASKFGYFILRLLYIDTPAHQMHLRLSLKNRTNGIFVLYQTLAQILIEDQYKYTQVEMVQILTKIKEKKNEIMRKLDKNVSLFYNCGNNQKSGIVDYTIPSQNTTQQLYLQVQVSDFLKFPQSLSYAIIQIYKKLPKYKDTQVIIKYILLAYGSLCHFQTIQHTQYIVKIKQNKQRIAPNLFQIEFNHYRYLQSNYRRRKSIRLSIEYSESKLKKTTTSQFYKLQQKIYGEYYKQLGSQYNVLINHRIYCLDERAILGKGAFGTTIQGQALQIINIKNQKQRGQQKITLQYELKNIAIKSFKQSSKSYQSKGYKVSQKREQLIHSLFGELKYCQMQKKVKKLFGIKTQRQLIGFSYLVVMQEIFHVKVQNLKQQNSQKIFIVFQQAKGSFIQEKIVDQLYKYRNNQNMDLYGIIFKQLFQGIYCLHYDINHLYSNLLRKYVRIQDKKQTYVNPNQIINPDQRCGIYHRDIKPANIVFFYQQNLDNIKHQGQIKAAFIDFGMAGIINFETNKTKTNCGSKYYMAPQIIESQGYNQKVDIWSIGVIMYEIYTSRKLFQLTQDQYEPYSLKSMQENLRNLDKKYHGEPIFVELIKGCLKQDKNLRLDIKQVLHLFYLNNFSVPPKKRQALLDSLHIDNKMKPYICCFKVKQSQQSDQQLVLSQEFTIKNQDDIKYCFDFGFEKLLQIQAINLELKVQILKVTLKAVVKRHNKRNQTNYAQLMDMILSSHILKTQLNKQEFIMINFTQKYDGNERKQDGKDLSQLKINKTIYQLNSSLTLKFPIIQKQQNSNQFILIFRQKQRTKMNSEHRYFQAYKIKFSEQRQTVSVQSTIYKQQKEDYQQYLNEDLFLTKSNLKQMIQTDGNCQLLWYYPQQAQTTQETLEKITLSLTNIIKYFNQNPKNKQSTQIHIRQKYSHKQDNVSRQTIDRLAKIWCENQIVRFQINTAALFRHTEFYQLFKTMLFNQQFKERYLSGMIQQLKRSEKLQFKYAYNLYLYQQAKDFAHFQQLKKQFSCFGQNPVYFISKLNMLANDIYVQCYKSKMKQVKKLYTYFMDDLQKVGNAIYKQMEQKFQLKGIRLQAQIFHNKIHYSKANLPKLYQNRQNIIQFCRIHPQQSKQIENVLDKYKQLFIFIGIMWHNMSQTNIDQRFNISPI